MKTERYFRIEKKLSDPSRIVGGILRDLPEHFGFESAIVDYMVDSRSPQFTTLVAFDIQEKPIGFIMMRDNNADVAEIWVLGVLKSAQNGGVGRALVEAGEREALQSGHKYVFLKTIGPAQNDPNYLSTYHFYLRNGYLLLDQRDYFWSGSWCAFLVKKL